MPTKTALEVVAEIEREDCIVTNALADVNCSIVRLLMRPDYTLHRVKPTESCDPIDVSRLKNLKLRRVGNGAFWIESPSCSVCNLLSRIHFVNPIGTHSIGKNHVQVRFLVASRGDLKLFKKELDNSGLKYTILSISPFVHQELTQKERYALEEALKRGYFDIEGRISLTELSHFLGVTPASLSELLRRGLKKTVSNYLYEY
ncbi:MAG: helix-turn-helix domain-containing protein [Thermoplasmatales archaeon]